MDMDSIFKRADLAAEEAFKEASKLVGIGLQLNQELSMNADYPPVFLINSSELDAQSVCVITTHSKGGHLVLRVWSPFETRRIHANGIGVYKKQDYHDFLYNNSESWDNNSREIGRLIWNYYSLLMDWHSCYIEDMEGFDLDE